MIGKRRNGIAGWVDVFTMSVEEREDERVEVDGFLRASNGSAKSAVG